MPVYNGGGYFRLALRSALAQTYQNVEIIVVNDGSRDNGETEAVARQHQDRIIYIQQENRGVAGALNTAIAKMTGDFFTWLSHDDIHRPHKAESQLAYFDRIGKPDAMLFSDYDLIDPDGNLIRTVRMNRWRFCESPMLSLLEGRINGCTLFIPRQILEEFGPFDESLRYTQDYDLWNKILGKYEFFHQPETLIQYRLHPGQDSHNPGAVTEGNQLWMRILDARSETERVHLFGSSRRFFEITGRFLEKTPYKDAARYALRRVAGQSAGTLVSVIIPFHNEVALALRAVRSVLEQTHERIEIILVDDGSTEDTAPLAALIQTESRVRMIRQSNAGPGAARNRGMDACAGDYIAFLDADDVFLPQKVQRQLEVMQRQGAVFSHTSYYVSFPERTPELGLMESGTFSGHVYPGIISCCPIATPTVMMHCSLINAGFRFPTGQQLGEDVIAWLSIARRHEFLGIPEPLTQVEWSSTSAALDTEKSVLGLMNILTLVESDPEHGRFPLETTKLRLALRYLASMRKARGLEVGAPLLQEAQIAVTFGATV
jgi:glycosyltransferase involved in cell wall biosynthesis